MIEVHLDDPWDIESAELVYTLDISDEKEEVRGIEFRPDEKAFFLLDTARREVLDLSPGAWRGLASLKNLLDVFDVSLPPRD